MTRRGPDPDRTNDIVLETERFTLRLAKPADAEAMFALVGGADRYDICQYLIWDGPDNLADITTWVERNQTATFADWGFHWLIDDRDGTVGRQGAVLGTTGTRPCGPPGRADVGYWLGKSYWRHGVMREVLTAVVDLGFNELNYQKLEADVFSLNVAGRALVESVGFRLEGVARSANLKNNEWTDTAFYGLLHEDWPTS